jgi:hypothetical protein
MTADMYLKRTRSGQTRYYELRLVSNVTDKVPQDAMIISLPGQDWTQATYLRFSGQQREMGIKWTIYDHDVDMSEDPTNPTPTQTAPNPPFSSGVKTLAEQVRYLRDFFFTPGERVKFFVYHHVLCPTETEVVPKGPTFTHNGTNPVEVDVDLDLMFAKNMI